MGNWTWYAVQGVLFSGDKPVEVKFFGNNPPLDILDKFYILLLLHNFWSTGLICLTVVVYSQLICVIREAVIKPHCFGQWFWPSKLFGLFHPNNFIAISLPFVYKIAANNLQNISFCIYHKREMWERDRATIVWYSMMVSKWCVNYSFNYRSLLAPCLCTLKSVFFFLWRRYF